jgi:hypothetical protein
MSNDLFLKIVDGLSRVERNDECVVIVYMGPKHFSDLRREEQFKDVFDFETLSENLHKGKFGTMYGVDFYVKEGLDSIRIIGEHGTCVELDKKLNQEQEVQKDNFGKLKFIMEER